MLALTNEVSIASAWDTSLPPRQISSGPCSLGGYDEPDFDGLSDVGSGSDMDDSNVPSEGPLSEGLPFAYLPRHTPLTPPPRTVWIAPAEGDDPIDQVKDNGSCPLDGMDHQHFCREMNGLPLPRDDSGRREFDRQANFILGDPAARYDRPCLPSYEVEKDTGFPYWEKIFSHILRHCGSLVPYNTVYVLVDTRDLAHHQVPDASLPHWPAAAAWWESRLQMQGPNNERTELLFFPATEETGLHNVHPTWAGTLVLAALGAAFPGINFILLDSDCLPVTLFEACDLWHEAYLARFPLGGDSRSHVQHPLHTVDRYKTDPYVQDTRIGVSHLKVGQGVLFVTEPHAELNAGFIVLFASTHPTIFDWTQWNPLLDDLTDDAIGKMCAEKAATITASFWALMENYLCRSLRYNELLHEERKVWLQTGPLLGTCAQYSIDIWKRNVGGYCSFSFRKGDFVVRFVFFGDTVIGFRCRLLNFDIVGIQGIKHQNHGGWETVCFPLGIASFQVLRLFWRRVPQFESI